MVPFKNENSQQRPPPKGCEKGLVGVERAHPGAWPQRMQRSLQGLGVMVEMSGQRQSIRVRQRASEDECEIAGGNCLSACF